MKEASDITALVFDHGLFLPVAQTLAGKFKRVLYHTPWEESFPQISKCVIGSDVSGVERCEDFWPLIDEIDLFVFPDIQHGGLQSYLKSIGKPVWGSGTADKLEINRRKFLNFLDESGLHVPPHKVRYGVTELRDYLKDKEDVYIKISKFRGDWETGCFRNWKLDEGMIDGVAHQFGPWREKIPFLVFDNIETEIEVGLDTFFVDGQWPDVTQIGYEKKDEAYVSAVQNKKQLPPFIEEAMEALTPRLTESGYCNSLSAEFRVAKDKAYFIDPCCRFPQPGTSSKLALLSNLPEFIWSSANGIVVPLQPKKRFSAEVCVKMKGDKKDWLNITVPDDMKEWLKLSNCGKIDGVVSFPPIEFREDRLGWIVSIGNTLKECVDDILDKAGKLPDGVSANTLLLSELIKEINVGEAEGIEFADTIPQPEIVVQ
jgi:hypothetical protein